MVNYCTTDKITTTTKRKRSSALPSTAQVSTRCGIVIVGLRCLLLSEVAIQCVKKWHLFLDLAGMCVINSEDTELAGFEAFCSKNVVC